MMFNHYTIVLVDDHPVYRDGLKNLIRSDESLDVVGEARDANEGLMVIKDLCPDLAVIDISLPDKSGIYLTEEIKANLPATKILIVSIHSKIEYIARSLQAGASGYINKESNSKRILEGIHAVLGGEMFIDYAKSSDVIKKLVESEDEDFSKDSIKVYRSLTPREREILPLIAKGLTSKEIGIKLQISSKTAEHHKSNIMRKLDLRNIAELVRYAIKIGLVDIDE